MGRKKLTKGQKQHRREKKAEAKTFVRLKRGIFRSWGTAKARISLRIKPETKELLKEQAKAKGMSMAKHLTQIAQSHLRRNAAISGCKEIDKDKPAIVTKESFEPAERRTNRSQGTVTVSINPMLNVTAKTAIQLEAQATGESQGAVVDRWVETYHKKMVAKEGKDSE